MLDDFYNGTNTYLRHVTDLLNSSLLEETVQYANGIIVASGKYLNNEITIEEFEQLVPAIEENYVTPEEIKVLNYIREMLIKSMPIDRSN